MTYRHKIERLLQERKDWSVRQLATHAGLKTSTAARLVKRVPDSAAAVARIAELLDVPLDWLLDDKRGWPPPAGGVEAVDLRDPIVANQVLRLLGDVMLRASRSPGESK